MPAAKTKKQPPQKGGMIPLVASADTMVVLSDRRHFKLLSITLMQNSELFAQLLGKSGPNLGKEARLSGVRYHIVLQNHDSKTGKEILPVFRRVALDQQGQPVKPVSVIHEGREKNVDPKLLENYERILASFFNVELSLDKTSVASAMEDTLGLLGCAEYLGAVPQIARSIDNTLISMGQALYKAIALAPVEWADVGFRLSSRIIFKDALIHLVGKYHRFTGVVADDKDRADHAKAKKMLDTLSGPVRALLDSKISEMKGMCQLAEQRVITYYPSHLYRQSVFNRANKDDIGRQSYSTDIFAWMALGLFRHYIGQTIAANETHQAKDGGYLFYKRIRDGGHAYLDRQTVNGFHERFPMSHKGRAVFANHLNSVKAAVQEFAAPLLRNETNLDISNFGALNWLVCTRIEDGDYPWEAQDAKVPDEDQLLGEQADDDMEIESGNDHDDDEYLG